MSPGSTGLSNNLLLAVSIIFSSVNCRLVGVYALHIHTYPFLVKDIKKKILEYAKSSDIIRCVDKLWISMTYPYIS